jgi:hypothetical protein
MAILVDYHLQHKGSDKTFDAIPDVLAFAKSRRSVGSLVRVDVTVKGSLSYVECVTYRKIRNGWEYCGTYRPNQR